MAGRHDRAGDGASPGFLMTGPIAIRGLSRGMREVLRPGPDSRHRASEADALADDPVGAGDSTGAQRSTRHPTVHPSEAVDVEAAALLDERADEDVSEQRPGGSDDQDAERPVDAAVDESASSVTRTSTGADGQGRDEQAFGFESLAVEPSAGQPVQSPRGPLRERLGAGAIGVVVLIVLAVVCVGLITAVVLKTRNDAELAAREAAAYTPPPLSSAAATNEPVVAIVGDEGATRAASGVSSSERWPALVGSALQGKVDILSSTGAGYLSSGANGDTFVQAAADVPTDADVVVFVGGAVDAGATSLDLAKAATRAFAAASERAPGAVVVAVGPLFVPAGADATDIIRLRSSLQSSARIADVRWVDPVRSNWVNGVDRTTDLTAAVERSIATRMGPIVEAASG